MHLQENILFDLDLKCDGWTQGRTEGYIDGRRTNFGMKLIYPLKKKSGYNYTLLSGGLFTI